ncbi:MAG: Polyribonucleotide nucleotidyltransferase [Phycisphaerae bacterium]|nr:Polyribonucleotide nucleotidyltransferase [Phycisphaerae bacterium]
MTVKRVEKEIGGRTLSIETGKLAKQAASSALVRYADTVVLAAMVTDKPRPGIDFFPLQVDYREKTSAAGKFPGGFFKREGRPTLKEVLTMRNIDRPLRPLFAKDFLNEVQIYTMVLSADPDNDPDVLAMIGAAACAAMAPVPWKGPLGAVRIGRVQGEYIINPTYAQREYNDMELLLAGGKDTINMIEVGSREVSEDDLMEGMRIGQDVINTICDMINELANKTGQACEYVSGGPSPELVATVRSRGAAAIRAAKENPDKLARNAAVSQVETGLLEALCGTEEAPVENGQDPKLVHAAFEVVTEEVVRAMILDGTRPDGRRADQVRDLHSEVSILPRTHGSAIFTRGQTQALVTTTLGTPSDEQIIDGLAEEYSKKFMLHYNFPSFSVGEARPIRGPGRREYGHGALAERCLEGVLPDPEVFPYTIRLVSDILESNGSSSMASVCGGTLALMDAGVPIKDPVAGISIGMVSEGGRRVMLTDIQGEEDHYGDMDFKVAGTQNGVTGIQLDLKIEGLTHEIIRDALTQAREARLGILKHMLQTLPKPRPSISQYAPRMLTIKINPEKIGKVIGPGGKTIKKIQEETGAQIDIEDDGTVFISSFGADGAERAREQVELLTQEVQLGRIYNGKVISIKDFGAFIEIMPGQDGLCHISELADTYVKTVSDVVKIGDMIRVKCIAIDDQGRVKLSRKQAMAAEKNG